MKYITKQKAKELYKFRKKKGEDVQLYHNKETGRVLVGTFKEWIDFIYSEKLNQQLK